MLWFHITQIALHCPCPESSSLIFHKMGCRHYFVADRLEDLVDEGDSRSSSRIHEHENFRRVSTACTLKSMSISSSWGDQCPPTGRSFYHDLDQGLVGLAGWLLLVEQLRTNSFIQSLLKEIFGGGRGDSYTFSYMISTVSIWIAFGIQ